MPDIMELQRTLLTLIYDKHVQGSLNWTPREGEDSYETTVDPFAIHIDKKKIGSREIYIVWVFDKTGVATDRIDTGEVGGVPPGVHAHMTYHSLIKEMYESVANAEKYQGLSALIGKLRSV